jgi:hypothetical protein
MNNLLLSSSSSFSLLEHVEQNALDIIFEQEVNGNYENFVAFRNRDHTFHMGKLCGSQVFLNIDATKVDDEKSLYEVE